MAGLWLAGEMVNRIGIYGSKVAEGLSAFQRRSCLWYIFTIENFRICTCRPFEMWLAPDMIDWKVLSFDSFEDVGTLLLHQNFVCDKRALTHQGWVMHVCMIEQNHYLFRLWLDTCMLPSHYLKQWCFIFNWNLVNKFQWNLNQNITIFIQENGDHFVLVSIY